MKPDYIQVILGKVSEELDQNERPVSKGMYRASEIGNCIRATQYSRLGFSAEKHTPEQELLFRDGTMHHIYIRELFAKVGTVSMIEHTISKQYKHQGQRFTLTGTLDFMFNGIPVDAKSMNTFKFVKLDKEFPDSYENYVMQLSVYMDILGKKQGMFVFKNKNDSELKIKYINRNTYPMEKILDRIVTIQDGIKKGVLIDRPYNNKDWHCEYCPFRLKCYRMPMKPRHWSSAFQQGAKDARVRAQKAALAKTAREG